MRLAMPKWCGKAAIGFIAVVVVLANPHGASSVQTGCRVTDRDTATRADVFDGDFPNADCIAEFPGIIVFKAELRLAPVGAEENSRSALSGLAVFVSGGSLAETVIRQTDASGEAIILLDSAGEYAVAVSPSEGRGLVGFAASSFVVGDPPNVTLSVNAGVPAFVDLLYAPAPPPPLSINIRADSLETRIVVDTLEIDSIDSSVILQPSEESALEGAPISSIDLADSPISSIPISSIPISSIFVDGSPISSIPISSIVLRGTSWAKVLAGTGLEKRQTHKVQLQEILDLPEGRGWTILSHIGLGQADVDGLRIGNADIFGLILGGMPIDAVEDVGESCKAYRDLYPEYFLKGSGCPVSLLEVQLNGAIAGTPISSIPISSIPISSIPISAIPISNIPISSIPISSIEANRPTLGSIPISSLASEAACKELAKVGLGCDSASLFDVLYTYAGLPGGIEGSPISSITLGALPISSIPISSIPISSIPISSIEASKATFRAVPINSLAPDDITALCSHMASTFAVDTPCEDSNLYDVLTLYAGSPGGVEGSPFAAIPISSIPISSIPISSIPISSIPISSIPISSIPISSIQAQEAILKAIPISSIESSVTDVCAHVRELLGPNYSCSATTTLYQLLSDIRSTGSTTTIESLFLGAPIANIPISSIDFHAIPISSIPISSIVVGGSPISSIPISSIFTASTAAAIDVSSVQVAPAALKAVPISSIGDVAASPISSIPISSIDVLGSPIDSIHLEEVGPKNGPAPCEPGGWVSSAHSCDQLGVGAASTLGDLVRALSNLGIPLRESSLAAVPISSIDLGSTPISSIDLGAIPISSIPISSITIRGLTLDAIPIVSGPSDLRGLVSCSPGVCPTLGEAAKLQAVKTGVTVGDVADIVGGPIRAHLDLFFAAGQASWLDAMGAVELGDLAEHGEDGLLSKITVAEAIASLGGQGVELDASFFLGDLTLGQLYDQGGLLDDPTLAELMLAMFDRDEYPWEELRFQALDPLSLVDDTTTLRTVRYAIDIVAASPGTLTVTLPDSFTLVANSSHIGGVASPPQVDGPKLTWENIVSPRTATTLEFEAYPGFQIGDKVLEARIVTADGVEASGRVVVSVVQSFDPDSFESPNNIDADTVYLGHIASPDDVDYYSFEVQPNQVVAYYLSHLSGDADMVLVRPAQGTETAAGRAAGRLIDGGIATDTSGTGLEQTGTISATESRVDGGNGQAVVGESSEQAGKADVIKVSAAAEKTMYTLVVEGYPGVESVDPYALRVKLFDVLEPETCAATRFAFEGEGVRSTTPLPTGDITSLFIVNQERLGDAFGASAAGATVDAIETLIASPSFPGTGAILYLDAVLPEDSPYSGWDESPCDADAANAVVAAVNVAVDAVRANSAVGLQNVVLVGGDEIVPFYRAPDPTLRWNERHYAADLHETGSATWGALATRHLLTDAPYGDFSPTAWLDRAMFVPDIGVGRLVETPAEIQEQVKAFIASKGRLAPQSGLAVGYSFLADGAGEIATTLGSSQVNANSKLISDDWTTSELLATFSQQSFDLVSLNAHFDHHALLSAAEDAANTRADLLTPAQLGQESGGGTLIFSMGCHAGLNVSGFLSGSPGKELTEDWAEVLTGNGAVFIANTGYGYGDTETVALSERLMVLFARSLLGESRDAGQALALAQHEYFGSLGVYSVYDEKVLMQSTFYGLPMYTLLGGSPGAASNNPLPTDDKSTAGLSSSVVIVSPDLEPRAATTTPSATYWTATFESRYRWEAEAEFASHPVAAAAYTTVHDRPIQPQLAVDVTQEHRTAHGAVIEYIAARADEPMQPVFSQPVIDRAAGARASATSGSFPLQFQNVTEFLKADGTHQNLVLIAGQFSYSGEGAGVQRLFDRMDARVYYHDSSDDFIEPRIYYSVANIVDNNIRFDVHADDRVPADSIGEASGTVHRIVVLVRRADNSWTPLELVRQGGSNTWTGSMEYTDELQSLDYFVQAVDRSGNVQVRTLKGEFFEPLSLPDLGDGLTISLVGPALLNRENVFVGPVTAVISAPAGGLRTYRLDGGPELDYEGPFTIIDGGYHVLEAFDAGTGESVSRAFFVSDGDVPIGRRIAFHVPRAGGSFNVGQSLTFEFECNDVGSGTADCQGRLPNGARLPTTSVGMETLIVSVRDGMRNIFTQAVSYTVGDVCSLPPTIVAEPGGETHGTPGDDIIRGTDGPDQIFGNGGNDIICAGGGADRIVTGGGNDFVDAGPGNDTVEDSGGHNLIRLGTGDDSASSGAGDDFLGGGGGNDTLDGGAGNDTLHGGSGMDTMGGGDGFDECIADSALESTSSCEVVRPG